jgi:hypothetical protein
MTWDSILVACGIAAIFVMPDLIARSQGPEHLPDGRTDQEPDEYGGRIGVFAVKAVIVFLSALAILRLVIFMLN